MTLIISWGCHALEDSNSDVVGIDIANIIRMNINVMQIIRENYRLPYGIDIVDIIRMNTNVMQIIRGNYRLPYVQYGGGRAPKQLIVARLPPIRGRWTSRVGGRYISC